MLGSKHIGVMNFTFWCHVTSFVTWPFDSPQAISYWWSFGTNQASISNGFRDIQWRMWRNGWRDLDTTSKQRSKSFILVPIDFLYATSWY